MRREFQSQVYFDATCSPPGSNKIPPILYSEVRPMISSVVSVLKLLILYQRDLQK